MKIDGVWIVEAQGPYGMQKISTALLRKRRYFTSSPDHYAIGSYKLDGRDFVAKVSLIQHGEVKALFGTKKKKVKMRMVGKINKEGDKIIGTARPAGESKYGVKFRLTLLADPD